MHRAIAAGVLSALLLVGSPALAAGKMNVIELSYMTHFGKPFVLHFAPSGGFSAKACKASLQAAIATFSADVEKAFQRIYGTDITQWSGASFVKGSCQAFDIPPPQLLNLKLSGK